MNRQTLFAVLLAGTIIHAAFAAEQSMDKMWGNATAKGAGDKSDRVAMFRDGNYGMFIH